MKLRMVTTMVFSRYKNVKRGIMGVKKKEGGNGTESDIYNRFLLNYILKP